MLIFTAELKQIGFNLIAKKEKSLFCAACGLYKVTFIVKLEFKHPYYDTWDYLQHGQ